MDLTPICQRVLGSLIEKQMTTPEHYPLTTNALVAAANQLSNRDPVTDYSEAEVLEAVVSLRSQDLVRSVKRPGDRVMKHQHDADRVLRLDDEQLAVLAVLLLRGPQTPGELRARTDRYTEFGTDIEDVLARLADHDEPLAVALGRQPGQKEGRWSHGMGQLVEPTTSSREAMPDEAGGLAVRVEALERQVAELQVLLGVEPEPGD